MAACVKCGKWAGLFSSEHEDCSLYQDANPIQESELVQQLRPVIYKAATRAGVACAVTLALIGLGLIVLRALVMLIWGPI